MKKIYEKPEITMISLCAQECIAEDEPKDIIDGEMGVESSIF